MITLNLPDAGAWDPMTALYAPIEARLTQDQQPLLAHVSGKLISTFEKWLAGADPAGHR